MVEMSPSVSPEWMALLSELRAKFCAFGGACGTPLPSNELREKFSGFRQLPEPFLALVSVAREWHSLRYTHPYTNIRKENSII